MNEFFDRLGAAAKRTANSVATNVNVAAEEQKLREYYQELGKLYFHASRKGEELTGPDFADQCRKIEAGLKRIRDLKSSKDVTGEEDFVDVD